MADVTEKLERLANLLEKGLITREQFEKERDALFSVERSPAPQGSSPNIGDSVGAYRILGELGRGGMGVVVRAKHRTAAIAKRQGGEVAIKVLHAQYAQDEVFRDRFEREASMGLKLDHPNIVKVHDLVIDGGNLALVMDLAEGRPLSEVIGQETGPIPWDRAWPMFKQMLDAVAYAHEHKVVHRDLKPENVILSPEGQLKVLDFGIAKDMEGGKTKTGTGMGTVDYMAPEQYLDAKRVDGRADIYALGMTLYEMLAGRLPWEKNTPEFTILEQKKNGALPPPTDFYPAIPPAVVAVVERATAVKIEDRYRSIKALTAALEGASGDGVSLMEDEAPKLVIGGGSPSAPAAPFKVGSRPKELLREEYPTLGWQLSKLFLMVVVAVGVSVVVIGFKYGDKQYEPKRAEIPSNIEALISSEEAKAKAEKERDEAEEVQEAEEAKKAKKAKMAKAAKDAKDAKDAKTKADAKEVQEAQKAKDTKAAKDAKVKVKAAEEALLADLETDPATSENIGLNNPADINRAVRNSLRRYKGQLEQCYNIELNEDESLKGSWQVSFTVEPTGKTSNVSVKGITRNHAGLEACILKNVNLWSFPRISDAYPYVKVYGFGR